MTIKWSDNQEAIFATNAGKESIIIEAVAGSGKTTTIVELANQTKACRALAIAFNKKIATELEERLPRHFESKTMNGLGHRVWMNHITAKVKLDKNKLYKLAGEINIPEEYMSDAIALMRAARIAGIIPDSSSGIRPDDVEDWQDMADKFDLNYSGDLYIYARQLFRESIAQAKRGNIDFDDQIYMPTLFGAKFPTYDMIMIDEVQDLSLLQHEMVAKLRGPKTRLIAVGDSRQAIYGFRGADSNSMLTFEKRFDLRPLPLTVSYRCPQNIVAEAQKYVAHIEASPGAPLGRVGTFDSREMYPEDYTPGSAILCRNTAPIVGLAWQLVRSNVSFKFLGRELGKVLTKIVTKLGKSEGIETPQFLANLTKWADREVNKNPKRESTIRNQQQTLQVLAQDTIDTDDILRKIHAIFDSQAGQITLGTIHRSKGLEFPTVYLLRPDLIPSEYATQDWQLEQEDNLMYVAITRAQQNFFYLK